MVPAARAATPRRHDTTTTMTTKNERNDRLTNSTRKLFRNWRQMIEGMGIIVEGVANAKPPQEGKIQLPLCLKVCGLACGRVCK